MKISIFIILILSGIPFLLTASAFDDDFDKLDELVMKGEFESLATQLDAFLVRTDQNLTESDKLRIEKYYRLITYESHIDTDEALMIQDFITAKRSERSSFSKDFAGEFAEESFLLFMNYADENKNTEAIKYYFIADYFRNQMLEKLLAQNRNIYKEAEQLYSNERYNETIQLIDGNSFDAGNNVTLLQYQDSLQLLREHAIAKQKQIDDQKFFWDRKEKIGKKLFVSLGLRSISQPAHENFNFVVYRDGFDSYIPVESVAKGNTVGLSGEILAHLSSHFAFGGEMVYTKFTYKNVFDQNLVFFDFDYTTFTTHLKTVYFIKSFVGIRPYIGAGIGFFHAKRENNDLKVLLNANNVTTITYQLPERTITSHQSLIEFGFQIVYNQNSQFFMNFKTSFYNNFESDEEMINSYYSLISANIGVMF